MNAIEIKSHLIAKLKQEKCFWSYDASSIQDVPDDMLVEMVMLYLDVDDIDFLFKILPYKKVKKYWMENVVLQGDIYYEMNVFFAWFYFHAKDPKRYVKALETRLLNKRLVA